MLHVREKVPSAHNAHANLFAHRNQIDLPILGQDSILPLRIYDCFIARLRTAWQKYCA